MVFIARLCRNEKKMIHNALVGINLYCPFFGSGEMLLFIRNR